MLALCPTCTFQVQAVPQVRSVFAGVPEGRLFGSCLLTIRRGLAGNASVVDACAEVFGTAAPGMPLADDCAEFGGRVAEAVEEGYLNDGRLLCGVLAREHAQVSGRRLSAYIPAARGEDARMFCEVVQSEASEVCAALNASSVGPASSGGSASQARRSGATSVPRKVLIAHNETVTSAGSDRMWADLEVLLHRSG